MSTSTPAATRRQRRQNAAEKLDALLDLLHKTLDLDKGSPLEHALLLSGVTSIPALVDIGSSIIDTLEVPNDPKDLTKGTYELQAGLKIPLTNFMAWMTYRKSNNLPTQSDAISQLTNDDYEKFRTSPAFIAFRTDSSTPKPPVPLLRSAVDDFRKGIKRDPSLFPTFKTGDVFEPWQRQIITQARAQNVDQVLDSTYTAVLGPDLALFKEQQRYMYAVFERTVQTQKGKAIVRAHHKEGDAQSVYKELCATYKESTKAILDSQELFEYIISLKLRDWKGQTEDFLLHFQEQCRQYHELVDNDSDKISDNMQMTFLQNAVHDHAEFAQVKATAMQLAVDRKKSMDLSSYVDMLTTTAVQYDKRMKTQGSLSRKQRVYQAFLEQSGASDDEYDEAFDIDTPRSTIEAYRMQQHLPGSRLTRDTWHSIPREDQEIWDMLSDATKAAILAAGPAPRSPSRGPASSLRKNVRFADNTRRPPAQTSRSFPPRPPASTTMSNISAADFVDLIRTNMTDLASSGSPVTSTDGEDSSGLTSSVEAPSDTPDIGSILYANLTQSLLKDAPAGHVAKLMSDGYTRPPESSKTSTSGDAGNPKTRTTSTSMAHVTYNVSQRMSSKTSGCNVLCDRGANGCIIGKEMRLIDTGITLPKVNIRAFDKHEQVDIPLVTAGAVIKTQKGEVIAIVHHGAHMAEHNTILSCGQMEYWDQDVNDKSRKVKDGLQRIRTKEGYVIPMDFRDGLPFISMRPFTDKEWESLPHMHLVDPQGWDPSVLDHDATEGDDWFDALTESEEYPEDNLFTLTGDYKFRHFDQNQAFLDSFRFEHEMCISVNKFSFFEDDPLGDSTSYNVMSADLEPDPTKYVHGPKSVKPTTPDYSKYRARFLYAPLNIVQKTFDLTTQYARLPVGDVLRRTFKSPFPLLNVKRREEAVLCDQVFSDTPAIDGGETSAILYVGRESLVKDVYGLKTGKDFPATLEDNITERGAMTLLGSDRGSIEISKRVKDLLRSMFIKSWQSEPHKQNQNFAERQYQDVKRNVNTLFQPLPTYLGQDRLSSARRIWQLSLNQRFEPSSPTSQNSSSFT